MSAVFIETYGCQMNQSESAGLEDLLNREGHQIVREESRADIVILNTCVVRQHAEDRIASRIGEFHHKHPGLKLFVAGCMAEQHGAALRKRFPNVTGVFGTANLHKIPEAITRTEAGTHQGFGDYRFPPAAPDPAKPYSGSLTVIHGCSNFCAYCIVPAVRGPERSRPSPEVLSEILRLADSGVTEILLLGQNVNAYGLDNGDIPFAELLNRVHEIKGLKKIRFLTSHPRDFSPKLAAAVTGLPRVEKRVHLPLQSGSDRILGLMNRRYTATDYLAIVERLRLFDGDLCLTTDILTGFPGETRKDHEDTLKMMRTVGFDDAYMFLYSPRRGTAASRSSESVPDEEKKDRLREIINLQKNMTEERLGLQTGRTAEMLIERPNRRDSSEWTGRTHAGRMIVVPKTPDMEPGDYLPVRVTGFRSATLTGVRMIP